MDWVGRNVGRGDLPGSGLEVEGALGRARRFRAGGARARCHEPLGGSETSNDGGPTSLSHLQLTFTLFRERMSEWLRIAHIMAASNTAMQQAHLKRVPDGSTSRGRPLKRGRLQVQWVPSLSIQLDTRTTLLTT